MLAVVSLVVFAGGLLVEGKLVLQTDPTQWVNQNSQVIKNLNVLNREVHSSSELGVYVQSRERLQPDNGEVRRRLHTRRSSRSIPDTLLTASGLVSTVSELSDVPGAPHLTPTSADVKAAYAVAPHDIKLSTVAAQATAMNIIFRTGPSGLDARADGRARDPSDGAPARGRPRRLRRVSPSSGSGCSTTSNANRVILTYISILFVFLFLSVRLRSIIRALLSLVPVLIAVGASSLFAYALSLKLSPMTAVGGPLVVAACTEFTSLMLLRFVEERRRGLAPRQAMDDAASRTGRAFIVSALTAISGVAVIATSSLPLLHDFGQIVALNVAIALLSALVILPPMLVWADKRNWVSRGLIPKDHLLPQGAAAEPLSLPAQSL